MNSSPTRPLIAAYALKAHSKSAIAPSDRTFAYADTSATSDGIRLAGSTVSGSRSVSQAPSMPTRESIPARTVHLVARMIEVMVPEVRVKVGVGIDHQPRLTPR